MLDREAYELVVDAASCQLCRMLKELEQCARSVLVQGSYRPPRRGPSPQDAGIAASLLRGEASADELLREYVTRVYARAGSWRFASGSWMTSGRNVLRSMTVGST